MRPLESLYRRVVDGKRARFLAGEGDIYRAPVPVIVVGNITIGGTGKTPLILWMIEHCRQRGLRVASSVVVMVPDRRACRGDVLPGQNASEAGDEPLLIVQRSGVPLMIDPDRSRAVQALLAAEPLDLILSDDGLQHYRLARDAIAAACPPVHCASRSSGWAVSMSCCTTGRRLTATTAMDLRSNPLR